MCIFQSEAENLRKERDMLKMVEIRLTQEKESIQAQQHGQSLLLSNLKSIQVMSGFMKQLLVLSHHFKEILKVVYTVGNP